MMSASAAARISSALRRWVGVACILGIQVTLIYFLENHKRLAPHPPEGAPEVRLLAENRPAEWLSLTDPTLFVLPHREGFSGAAWMNTEPHDFQPPDWSEPVQYLALPAERLKAELKSFLAGAATTKIAAVQLPEPKLTMPQVAWDLPKPTNSVLRMEGALASRRMLSAPSLPVWPAADLLTNSVVQLVVDARGNPVSAVLLRSAPQTGAKQREADLFALETARSARFERRPAGELAVGTMIFEWQTILTNPPVEAP